MRCLSTRLVALLASFALTACGVAATAPSDQTIALDAGAATSLAGMQKCPSLPRRTRAILISPADVQLAIGASVTLTAFNQEGVAIPNCNLVWESAGMDVAVVSSLGVVTGRNDGGPVAITATVEKKKGSLIGQALVTVTTPGGWSPRTSMPAGVRAAASATDGTRIYVIGGNAGWATATDHNQIYDPATDTWSLGAPLPAPRDWTMGAAMADGIHVVGGVGASGWATEHWVYSPTANSWAALAPIPIAVDAAQAQVVGGKLYVIGGADISMNPWATGAVQIYDPGTNSWSVGQAMPTPRLSATSTVIGGMIYVAGGQTAGIGTTNVLERYDPATDTWTTLAPMPALREALGGGTLAGAFCVFGGRLSSPTPTGDAQPETYCYHSSTNTWISGPNMLSPRVEMSAVNFGGSIYAIGGRSPAELAVAVNEVLR